MFWFMLCEDIMDACKHTHERRQTDAQLKNKKMQKDGNCNKP